MAGKDFSGINTGRVYEAIEQSTGTRGRKVEASPQEARQRINEMRTQGKKGVKAPRINFAFSGDNYDYIKIMARASGKTMTEFINLVISRYREEHPDIYEQAKAIAKQLEGLDLDGGKE